MSTSSRKRKSVVEEGKEEKEEKRSRVSTYIGPWYCNNDPLAPACSATEPTLDRWDIESVPYVRREECEVDCKKEMSKHRLPVPLQQTIEDYLSGLDIGKMLATAPSEAGYIDLPTMFPEMVKSYEERSLLVEAYERGDYEEVLRLLTERRGVSAKSLENLIRFMDSKETKVVEHHGKLHTSVTRYLLRPENFNILTKILTDPFLYGRLTNNAISRIGAAVIERSNDLANFTPAGEPTEYLKLTDYYINLMIAANLIHTSDAVIGFYSQLFARPEFETFPVLREVLENILNRIYVKNPHLFTSTEAFNAFYGKNLERACSSLPGKEKRLRDIMPYTKLPSGFETRWNAKRAKLKEMAQLSRIPGITKDEWHKVYDAMKKECEKL